MNMSNVNNYEIQEIFEVSIACKATWIEIVRLFFYRLND